MARSLQARVAELEQQLELQRLRSRTVMAKWLLLPRTASAAHTEDGADHEDHVMPIAAKLALAQADNELAREQQTSAQYLEMKRNMCNSNSSTHRDRCRRRIPGRA